MRPNGLDLPIAMGIARFGMSIVLFGMSIGLFGMAIALFGMSIALFGMSTANAPPAGFATILVLLDARTILPCDAPATIRGPAAPTIAPGAAKATARPGGSATTPVRLAAMTTVPCAARMAMRGRAAPTIAPSAAKATARPGGSATTARLAPTRRGPSGAGTIVRSASCRLTTVRTAVVRAAERGAPSGRSAGMIVAASVRCARSAGPMENRRATTAIAPARISSRSARAA